MDIIQKSYVFLVNINNMSLDDYESNWTEDQMARALLITHKIASHLAIELSGTGIEVSIKSNVLSDIEGDVTSFPIVANINGKDIYSSAEYRDICREAVEKVKDTFPNDVIKVLQMQRHIKRVDEEVECFSGL